MAAMRETMQDIFSLFLSRFGKFTKIQELSFDSLRGGRNCLILAPTGSGKTEAAILPVIEKIKKGGKKGIFAIYITPLRSLNRDLINRISWLCDEAGIKAGVRHGDTGAPERRRQAESPPQLLITTPESIQGILLSSKLREHLKDLAVVIIDEVHELYYNKRGAQLAVTLERLVRRSGEFQRIGLSATVGDAGEAADFLFGKRDYEVIRSGEEKKPAIYIEMPVRAAREHRSFMEKFSLDEQSVARIERVADLVAASRATILFANTRSIVESLGSKLMYLDSIEHFGPIGIHHGSLDKDERISIEERFKKGDLRCIVATSSLELGIDVGAVDLVIQYGSPRQAARLIQRVGRSGHRSGLTPVGRIIVSGPLDAAEAASVAYFAGKGELEMQRREQNALDVAMNQLCGIALEYGSIGADDVLGLLKNSSAYSSLSDESFRKVIEFGEQAHLIKVRDGRIGISERTRSYFIENITVIPDYIKFKVKNVLSNRIISTLDEKFVYDNIDEGAVFITKGMPWKVVSIDEDVVFVEPGVDLDAVVPAWEGEEIPVSEKVAKRCFGILFGDEKAGLGDQTAKELSAFRQSQKGFFMPREGTLVIEELEDYAIIYLPLGTMANEFISKVISGFISANLGFKVNARASPYAVILDMHGGSRKADIKKLLSGIRANYAAWERLVFSEWSDLYRYKFVQIAKLFGVVEKRAGVTRSMATKLINFYKGSVIEAETIRDLKKNYFDYETALHFIASIGTGNISIEVFSYVNSPLSVEIMRPYLRYGELLSMKSDPDMEIEYFLNRFNSRSVMFICTYCGFEFREDISIEAEKTIVCPSCGSAMVSISKENYPEALRKKSRGSKMTRLERDCYREMIRCAGLVSAYGSRAVVALLTYGVGLETASRVLRMMKRENKEFIKDLIYAQKEFVRTKKYWKS